MAITTQQIAERLFKEASGVSETNYPLTSRGLLEEAYSTYNAVAPNDIWRESSSIPPTPPILTNLQTSGVVQYFEKDTLTITDIGTTRAFKSNNLKDAISTKFGFGYKFRVYNNSGTTEIFTGDWIVDVEAGILFFYSNPTEATISAALPPKISFFKYIGAKGFPVTLNGNNIYTNSTNTYQFPSNITLSGGASIDLTGGNLITGVADISPTELANLDGVTSNIQAQLNDKASLTANNIFQGTNEFQGGINLSDGVLDLTGMIYVLLGHYGNYTQINQTELTYLDGATSNIQTQINTKAGLATTNTFSATNTFNASSILNVLTLLKFVETTISTTSTIGTNGNYIKVTGGVSITVTLPTASGTTGRLLIIYSGASGGIKTISGNINGVATTRAMTTIYDFVILISNGSTWVEILNKLGGIIGGA